MLWGHFGDLLELLLVESFHEELLITLDVVKQVFLNVLAVNASKDRRGILDKINFSDAALGRLLTKKVKLLASYVFRKMSKLFGLTPMRVHPFCSLVLIGDL